MNETRLKTADEQIEELHSNMFGWDDLARDYLAHKDEIAQLRASLDVARKVASHPCPAELASALTDVLAAWKRDSAGMPEYSPEWRVAEEAISEYRKQMENK